MEAAPRIYLLTTPGIFGDVIGWAMAQDGGVVWSFEYPTAEIAMKAMSGRLKQYRERYPDGYELVIAEEDDPGFREAQRLNLEAWEAGKPERETRYTALAAGKLERDRVRVEMMDGGDDLAVNQPDCWPGE